MIARQVLAPADLEERFGLTGGNIMQGVMSLSSLSFMRPVPGYADYRTPIRGLYLCGAATHPGGGVMGACGYNAAREILRDASGRRPPRHKSLERGERSAADAQADQADRQPKLSPGSPAPPASGTSSCSSTAP